MSGPGPEVFSPLPSWLQQLLRLSRSSQDVAGINADRRPPQMWPSGGVSGAAHSPLDVVPAVRPDALPSRPSFEQRLRKQIAAPTAEAAASTQTPTAERIGQFGNLTPLTLDDVVGGVSGLVKNPKTTAERLQNAAALAMLVVPGIAGEFRGLRGAVDAAPALDALRGVSDAALERASPLGVTPLPEQSFAAVADERASQIARRITAHASPVAEKAFQNFQTRKMVRNLHDAALSPAGGATLDAATGQPTRATGYAVADPKFTLDLTGKDNPRELTHDWLTRPEVQSRLEQPGAHIGSWRNPKTNAVEINVSDMVPDRAQALQLGRERGQDALGQLDRGQYVGDVSLGPKPLQDVVAQYRAERGLTAWLPEINGVDAARGKQMAQTYEGLQSTPNDPATKAAYAKFGDEVDQQAAALKKAGYTWDFVDKDPYANSGEMLKDLRENHHINVYKTEGAQSHPLLTNEQNNTFRAIHDILGHGVGGYGFGPKGEELAYRAHAAMFSPEAQRVLATETRGQNSWFNFGPKSDLPVKDRPFATQKAALWPTEQLGDYSSFPKPETPGVPPFEEDAPPPSSLPGYVGAKMPRGDVTTLGESLAHHLAGNADRGTWFNRVAQENPFLGKMLHTDPGLTDRVYKAAAAHQDFANDLLPYSEIAAKADQGGPAWDNWYGPYLKALREAGVPEDVAHRMLRTSSILSTQKAPAKEVLTALQTWQAHEMGEPITTQTTQHTKAITEAAKEAIQGGPWVPPDQQTRLSLRQKTSNYVLSELLGGRGDAPTLDTWHARAYLGDKLPKYLDEGGNLKLSPPQWRVMQARTAADASQYGASSGDFQARVWGGENGYTPSYGENGANRADWLAQHLGSGDFGHLIGKYPGLSDLAEQGRAASEAFAGEAEGARQKQLDLFAYLRNR